MMMALIVFTVVTLAQPLEQIRFGLYKREEAQSDGDRVMNGLSAAAGQFASTLPMMMGGFGPGQAQQIDPADAPAQSAKDAAQTSKQQTQAKSQGPLSEVKPSGTRRVHPGKGIRINQGKPKVRFATGTTKPKANGPQSGATSAKKTQSVTNGKTLGATSKTSVLGSQGAKSITGPSSMKNILGSTTSKTLNPANSMNSVNKVSSSKSKLSNSGMKMPTMKMPTIKMPTMKLPTMKMPTMKMPKFRFRR